MKTKRKEGILYGYRIVVGGGYRSGGVLGRERHGENSAHRVDGGAVFPHRRDPGAGKKV